MEKPRIRISNEANDYLDKLKHKHKLESVFEAVDLLVGFHQMLNPVVSKDALDPRADAMEDLKLATLALSESVDAMTELASKNLLSRSQSVQAKVAETEAIIKSAESQS